MRIRLLLCGIGWHSWCYRERAWWRPRGQSSVLRERFCVVCGALEFVDGK